MGAVRRVAEKIEGVTGVDIDLPSQKARRCSVLVDGWVLLLGPPSPAAADRRAPPAPCKPGRWW